MDDLKIGIYAMILIAFASGIASTLCPGGGIKKYLRYIAALCMLLTLISPLASLINASREAFSFEGFDQPSIEAGSSGAEQLLDLCSEELEQRATADISALCGVSVELSLPITASDGAVRLGEIQCRLPYQTAQSIRESIEAYIEKYFGTGVCFIDTET